MSIILLKKRYKVLVILNNSMTLRIMQIILKLTCGIFMTSDHFCIFFYTYKNVIRKIQQLNFIKIIKTDSKKKKKKKKSHERIKVFLKRKKSGSMVVSNTKMYQNIKNKSFLSIYKNYKTIKNVLL